MQGTITWILCADDLPPKKENNPFHYSEEVLITDGETVEKAVYCFKPVMGTPYWHEYFLKGEPTHWAYINLPE